jgi:hypothetical protein
VPKTLPPAGESIPLRLGRKPNLDIEECSGIMECPNSISDNREGECSPLRAAVCGEKEKEKKKKKRNRVVPC